MNLLRSEWTKLRSVRSTWIIVATTVVSAVALGIVGASDVLGSSPSDLPTPWDPTATSLKGLLFAQLLIGMLGSFSVTGEYAPGMIGTSLSVVPSRSRLLAAKTAVTALLALGTSILTTAISFTVVHLALGHAGLPAAGLGDAGVARALLAATAYLTLVALAGLAVGVLTRSTAGTLAVLVGALLLVPALAPGLPGAAGDWFDRYWPATAGQAAYTVVRTDAVTPGAGLAILSAAVAAVWLAGHLALRMRDI
ncbi:MAG TPA: ABC transporter permease [Mycobacteriales bacterium]|nr:ABC transporter permease [Mycobacteriales bacterium]